MIKGLSWIAIIFSVFANPYTWGGDVAGSFIATLYFLVVIYLCYLNIRK